MLKQKIKEIESDKLRAMAQYLSDQRIAITFFGKAWGGSTNNWIYFDTEIDVAEMRERFDLGDNFVVHENLDPKSGMERGFIYQVTGEAIMGIIKSVEKQTTENPTMKEVIRTPEARFENLEGYNFASNYLHLEEGLRMHYLDEGNVKDPVVLLLHGEPSWSYLYRKMIPILSEKFRVIAPDLIGFGKSDKLIRKEAYSYQNHLRWMTTFIKKLGLNDIILFCQDWGGLIGLRMVTEMEDRFSMVVASNTTLPTGNITMPESFMKWREYSQHSPGFDIGKVIDKGTVQSLSEKVIEAYNAPFPSEEHKACARIFPMLVPIEEEDPEAINNVKAWQKLRNWKKPFLTIFGDSDPIMRGAEKAFQKLVPGTEGQDHKILNAGHFIQEEKGEELAELMIEFYEKNA